MKIEPYYDSNGITIYNADCFDILPMFEEKSIDLILTDMPYNITPCNWDKQPIDINKMWEVLKSLGKDNAGYVFTASQPFTSKLIMSNLKWFKYCWVWNKKIPSGMSYARYQPMKQTEDVVVFCGGRLTYNAQMIVRKHPIKGGGMSKGNAVATDIQDWVPLKKIYTHKNPVNIITFSKVRHGSVHPTQKPIALMEYLIKTYTNEGEIILDFTMGSGTTLVAAKTLGRKAIGIEISKKYCDIAIERLQNVQPYLL